MRGDLQPVLRPREDQPRAEGRRRVRIRGGAVQPHRQRLGHDRQHHAERRAGAARALLHAAAAAARSGRTPTRCSCRTTSAIADAHVAQRRPPAESRRVFAARRRQRRLPGGTSLKGGAAVYESNGDTCDVPALRLRATKSSRASGVSYQLREGKGDKAYAHWGRYYNMDQKSSGRSLAPSRIFQTQTVFDLNGNVLSSGPLASTTGKLIDPDIEADLHRRDPGRLCDAARRRLQPRRVLHVADDEQLHRGCAVAHERHGARQRPVRRGEPAVRGVRGVPGRGRAAHLPRGDDRRPPAACRTAG